MNTLTAWDSADQPIIEASGAPILEPASRAKGDILNTT